MLNSNIISRVLPKRATRRSIYEELRTQDDADESHSDIEAQTKLTIDEENLQLQGNELEYLGMTDDQNSPIAAESSNLASHLQGSLRTVNDYKEKDKITHSKWISQSPRFLPEDGDEDVPASLLIEEQELAGPSTHRNTPKIPYSSTSPKIFRNTKKNFTQWESSLGQKSSKTRITRNPQNFGFVKGNARERALWRWVNITNLDNFIRDLYDYYTGAGIWCILLERILNLM